MNSAEIVQGRMIEGSEQSATPLYKYYGKWQKYLCCGWKCSKI